MSKKNQIYKQARMRRENTIDVSWIPSQFAKVGRVLSFKNGEEWTDGWKVEEVYSGQRTIAEIDQQRDAQKRWEEVLSGH